MRLWIVNVEMLLKLNGNEGIRTASIGEIWDISRVIKMAGIECGYQELGYDWTGVLEVKME